MDLRDCIGRGGNDASDFSTIELKVWVKQADLRDNLEVNEWVKTDHKVHDSMI